MRCLGLILVAALVVSAVIALVVAPGCGGGGEGPAAEFGGVGSVAIVVAWPEVEPEVETELLPAASNSIKVELFQDTTPLAEKTVIINRPQTTAHLDDVPSGEVLVKATAYPQAAAGGVAQAQAETTVTVTTGQRSECRLTLSSTIDHVDITPDPAVLAVGETRPLHATAKSPADETVLVPPTGAFTWAQLSGSQYFSLDADGNITGLAAGSGTVQATENESGVAGTATVTCRQAGIKPDLAAAMAVPLAAVPAAGSAANLAALSRLQYDDEQPRDAAKLRDELRLWIDAATANPDDAAAQLGLAMAILAVANYDGAEFLGYDLFAELDIQPVIAAGFSSNLTVANFIADGLSTAALGGVPRVRGTTAPAQVRSGGLGDEDTTVGDLQDYRQAVRDYLLAPLQNVVNRCAAIGDNAAPATQLVSLEITDEVETYTLYAADFQGLAGALQLVRCGLLMVSAIDPDYGAYEWDLDMIERDANHDGVLTVAEYAPPLPFGNVDGPAWTAAGDALANAAHRLRVALRTRRLGDANEVVNRGLEDQDIPELEGYLDDANALLAGRVNVTVDYGYWDEQTQRYTDEDTVAVPFDLRALWDNPPANFRAWAPTTYIMLDQPAVYRSADNTIAWDVHPSDWYWDPASDQHEDNFVAGRRWYFIDQARLGWVQLPIAGAPHNFQVPAAGGFAGANLSFNADWSVLQGVFDGAPIRLTRDVATTYYPDPLGFSTKWDAIPDTTVGGVFPNPNKIRDLIAGNYDKLNITYGSIFIGETTLPVIITRK